MAMPKFMARQLARPSGWFGRHVMGRFLNRKTAAHNDMVRRELGVAPSDRVLEIGFGGAALLEQLGTEARDGTAVGVEVSDEMLASGNKRLRKLVATGRVVLKQASAEALPFADEEFDKACTVNTTYFWPDLHAGLSEVRRVLRPGGRLVVGFMAPEEIIREGLHRHGFSLHSPEELALALRAASFTVGELRSGSDSRGTFYVLTAVRTAN